MTSTQASNASLLSSLRASEERYRNLVEHSSDWIWEVDQNGIYTYCSPQCIDMLGYQPKELLGKTPFDLMPPEEAQRIGEQFQSIVLEKTSFSDLENINIHKEGHQVIMETSGNPFFDELGNLLGFRGMDRDITARKNAEQALKVSEKNLETTLNSIGDAVIVTDTEQQIIRMNPVAEQLTEWSFAKALGQPVGEIFNVRNTKTGKVTVNPVSKVVADKKVIQLASGNSLITRSGTHIQIADSAAPIIDEAGCFMGVVLVFHDVTQQYKIQQALQQSNRQFSAFVSAMPDIAFILDEQGRYINIYGTERHLLYQEASRLLNKTVTDVLPDALAEQIMTTIQLTLDSNETHVLEYDLELPQGQCYFEGRVAPMTNITGESRLVVWVARDITEKKQILQSLLASEQRFRQIFENMPNIAVQGYNSDRKVIYWNKTSEMLYGYTAQEAFGEKLEELIIPGDLKEHVITSIENFFYNDIDIPAGELLLQRKDGSSIPVNSSHIKLEVMPGQVEMFCIDIDLTDTKRANAAVEKLAYYDSLTGLANRRLFLDRLTQEQKGSKRKLFYSAILFLDLDHFKTLNDSLGHSVGDLLLTEVGQRMQNVVREEDTVARLGGDEFVVLLKDLSVDEVVAAKQAGHIAEKIMVALILPIKIRSHEYIITTSIGITLFSGAKNSADTLLKQADTAMYRAKNSGRNNFQFFHPSMQVAADKRLALEKDLHQALRENELALYYQPQFDLYGNITGAEALLRWQHPTRGMVSPAEFIPVAEEAGLIIAIGDWIIAKVCKQLQWWEKQGLPKNFHLAINVSPKQFRMQAFVSNLQRVIKQYAINPEHLTLELTEGIVIDNIQRTIDKMRALKAIGVKFSIDDFGTGYSSLVYLKQLPLDQLKVDQAFIRDIQADPNDAVIVEAIISMAKLLGLNVVAEGVETLEQLMFLQDQGCHNYQGHYFCKPLPVVEFTAKLKELVVKTADLKGVPDIPFEAGNI